MKEIDAGAPAKVNLYLEVLGRREDGFHELRSIFQAVSLEDRLIFRSLPGGAAVELEGPFGFDPADNLIVRAARTFQEATGIRRGVRIQAQKRIPMGAGLGGGSSDAACTLAALNRLWAAGLDRAALRALAERLGSDVPFFLQAAAALVEGRGERVRPLKPRSDFCLLLVVPGFPVPTAAAYGWLDACRRRQWKHRLPPAAAAGRPAEELEVMYREAPVREWKLENSFDAIVGRRFPALGRIKRCLLERRAVHAGLSGSGSAVFGLFPDREEAAAAAGEAARELSGCNYFFQIVTPLAQVPWQ